MATWDAAEDATWDAAEAPWEAADEEDAEDEDAEDEDAEDEDTEDALGGLALMATRARRHARWTRRESRWLIAHITPEKLATSSRIGNWVATARAFKDKFGYERSEKSFATQAGRLRDEPERLQRQPRERQADGVASERPPETRKKRAVQPQPRDWSAEQRARESRFCRWNSAEEEWLAARVEEHAAGVTRRLADGAQYKALAQNGGGAAGGGAPGEYPRNGARGGVPWDDFATEFKAEFGKTRTAQSLRFHYQTKRAQQRALEQRLLQQRETSPEVFRLLGLG
jgi:hypothetical protein